MTRVVHRCIKRKPPSPNSYLNSAFGGAGGDALYKRGFYQQQQQQQQQLQQQQQPFHQVQATQRFIPSAPSAGHGGADGGLVQKNKKKYRGNTVIKKSSFLEGAVEASRLPQRWQPSLPPSCAPASTASQARRWRRRETGRPHQPGGKGAKETRAAAAAAAAAAASGRQLQPFRGVRGEPLRRRMSCMCVRIIKRFIPTFKSSSTHCRMSL